MTRHPTPIYSSLLKCSKLLAAVILASVDTQMTKLKPKSPRPQAQKQISLATATRFEYLEVANLVVNLEGCGIRMG